MPAATLDCLTVLPSVSPAYAWQLGRAGAGCIPGTGMELELEEATRHAAWQIPWTETEDGASLISVCAARCRTDGRRLGGSGIHPSIHPSNGPTHPTRAPPQSSNREFDVFHSAQHTTTSTHAVRARRSHVLMPPPPGRVSPLPPSLSCPVLSCPLLCRRPAPPGSSRPLHLRPVFPVHARKS